MQGISNSIRCWCCRNFKVRFDSELLPQKIDGGICIIKRQECKPYDDICKSFSINDFLIKNISYEDFLISEKPKKLF